MPKLPYKILFGLFLLQGCADISYEPEQDSAPKRMSEIDYYFSPEQQQQIQRISGKRVCGMFDQMLIDFSNAVPSKNCIYHGTGMAVIRQVIPGGLLVSLENLPQYYMGNKTFLVYKSNGYGSGLADDSPLPKADFEYVGTYTYNTLIGPKTVYAFRPIDLSAVMQKPVQPAPQTLRAPHNLRILPIGPSRWQYSDTSNQYSATTTSLNSIRFTNPINGIDRTNADLLLRNQSDTQITFQIGDGFVACSRTCQTKVSFDYGKPQNYLWNSSPSGKSNMLTLKNPEFLKRLKASSLVTIQFEMENEGLQEVDFDVHGLKW